MNLLTGPLRPPARHRKHGWPARHLALPAYEGVRFVARSYEDIIGSLERQHATGLETAHEFVSGKDMETLVPVLLAEGFTKITAPPWGFGSGHRIEVGRREQ